MATVTFIYTTAWCVRHQQLNYKKGFDSINLAFPIAPHLKYRGKSWLVGNRVVSRSKKHQHQPGVCASIGSGLAGQPGVCASIGYALAGEPGVYASLGSALAGKPGICASLGSVLAGQPGVCASLGSALAGQPGVCPRLLFHLRPGFSTQVHLSSCLI